MHGDVYNMPVFLRKFYLNKLIQVKEQERKDMEKSTKQNSSQPQSDYKTRYKK